MSQHGDEELTSEKKPVKQAWGEPGADADTATKEGDPPVGEEPNNEEVAGSDDGGLIEKDLRGTRMPVGYLEMQMSNNVHDAQLLRELGIFLPFLVLFLFFSLAAFSIQEAHFALGALRQETLLEWWPIVPRQNRTLWNALNATGKPPIMDIDLAFKDIGELSNYRDYVQFIVPQLMRCGEQIDSGRPAPTQGFGNAPPFATLDPSLVDANGTTLTSGTAPRRSRTATIDLPGGLGVGENITDSTIGNITANMTSNNRTNSSDAGAAPRRNVTLPRPTRGMLYPIGALRLRTQMVRNDSCGIHADVINKSWTPEICSDVPVLVNITTNSSSANASFTLETRMERQCEPNPFPQGSHTCYGENTIANEVRVSPRCNKLNPYNPDGYPLFEYKSCELTGGIPTTTELDQYHCGGYIADIPFDSTCDMALEFVDLMLAPDCPFVDDRGTRVFIAEWFNYAANLDIHVATKLIVEVTPGGGFITSDQYRAFIVQTSSRNWLLVLDFFFFAFVIYYLIEFVLAWRRFYKQEGKILMYLANIWTLVDAVNAGAYLAVFVLRWMWWSYSVSYSNKALPSATYPVELERILFTYSQMRYAIAFNFILTFLKILKFLRVSDRLGVITSTFERSQSDIFGLIILFTLFVTGFALSGHFLFGYSMYDFSSLDRAFTALMNMLLGDLDYDSMKLVNPVLAGAYFWLYLIIAWFLILNFIVAVIGDAFNAAGSESFIAPLDVALMQTLGSIGFTLHPRNIAKQCKLIVRKKSVLHVETQMLSYVKNGRLILELRNPGAMEIMVTAEQVFEWLPPPVQREADFIFNFRWRQTYEEYRLFQSSPKELIKTERVRSIVSGTRYATRSFDRAVGDTLTKLERVEAKAEEASEQIRKLLPESSTLSGSVNGRPGSMAGMRGSSQGSFRGGSLARKPSSRMGKR